MDTMMPKQAGFYGQPFSASRGVRQGDVMSPIIFNIIADAVIRHSEAQISEGREVQRLPVNALFYADDGVLTGEDSEEVQKFLDIYTEAFARVGLKMNAGKTKAMIMNGGNIRQALSMRAYCRRVEGVGESHRERSLQKVKCELCGAEVNRQHLKVHQTRRACNTGQKDYQATLQNHVAELSRYPPESIEVEEPESQYLVSMDGVTKTTCPVANCPFGAVIPGKMRKHFRARHMRDTIIVEEEGHLPRCVGCGLFQRSVGIKHQQTADCIRWTKIREDREADKVNKETVAGTVFHVQGVPIETVSEFKYLG